MQKLRKREARKPKIQTLLKLDSTTEVSSCGSVEGCSNYVRALWLYRTGEIDSETFRRRFQLKDCEQEAAVGELKDDSANGGEMPLSLSTKLALAFNVARTPADICAVMNASWRPPTFEEDPMAMGSLLLDQEVLMIVEPTAVIRKFLSVMEGHASRDSKLAVGDGLVWYCVHFAESVQRRSDVLEKVADSVLMLAILDVDPHDGGLRVLKNLAFHCPPIAKYVASSQYLKEFVNTPSTPELRGYQRAALMDIIASIDIATMAPDLRRQVLKFCKPDPDMTGTAELGWSSVLYGGTCVFLAGLTLVIIAKRMQFFSC
ncbi:hypothetical protein BSKO_11920 [Bryopsis sp. KO-2023]|nr:hypothetical protein BSKO_11920 [Bryopsis sp. KO-2023]